MDQQELDFGFYPVSFILCTLRLAVLIVVWMVLKNLVGHFSTLSSDIKRCLEILCKKIINGECLVKDNLNLLKELP